MIIRTYKPDDKYCVEFTQGVHTFSLESIWDTEEEAEWMAGQLQIAFNNFWNEAIAAAAYYEVLEDCVTVRGDIFIDRDSILKLLK